MNFDKAAQSMEIHWKIHNFTRKVIKEIKDKLVNRLRVTILENDNKITWALWLNANADRLSLIPHLDYADKRNFRVQFSWLIPTKMPKVNIRRHYDHFEAHCNKYEEFKDGLSFDNLDDLFNDPSNYFIDENILTIKIRIDLFHGFEPKSIAEEMNGEFERFFTSKLCSDLTVVCSDGEEIPAHRILLAVNSPVFYEMLESPLMEMIRKRLVFNDINGKIMNEILIFLYGQDPDHLTQKNFEEIFYVAEKYQIADLKEKLVEKMIQHLSINCVFEYLQLAVFYKNNYLLLRCLIFIKYNAKELIERYDFTPLGANILNIIKEFANNYKIKYRGFSSTLPNK